jgi:two-component system sensor histidine kinase SenX3
MNVRRRCGVGASGPDVARVRPTKVQFVAPYAFGLLGLVLGVVGGGLGVWWLLRRAERREPPDSSVPEPGELIDILDTAVLWVGEHDEVMAASPRATSLGLARGRRVTSTPVLSAVRQVRAAGEPAALTVTLNLGLRVSIGLDVTVVPSRAGTVFVVAVDNAGQERADVAVQDFVANTSHELKTPIGAISLLAEALEAHPDEPATTQRFAGSIMKEAARLADLVSQLIALSRLQADDPMLRAVPIRTWDLCHDVADRFAGVARARGVALTVTGDEDVVVEGDREQLETALANLVHNAVVYSGDERRVTVATRAVREGEEDFVELSVVDNGVGIGSQDQARVFERFYRVDYARDRDSGGTGLGLPIARHIAQAHGGDVLLWSHPGRGSTFTIRIPSHQTEAV